PEFLIELNTRLPTINYLPVAFNILEWKRQFPKGVPRNVYEALQSKSKKESYAKDATDAFLLGQKTKHYVVIKVDETGKLVDKSYSTEEIKELPDKLFTEEGKLVIPGELKNDLLASSVYGAIKDVIKDVIKEEDLTT